MHMVFECERYQALRQQFADLFEDFGGWDSPHPGDVGAGGMLQFMNNSNQRRVAQFVHSCWRVRCRDPPDEFVFGECLDGADGFPSDSTEWFDAHASFENSSDYTEAVEAFDIDSEFDVFYDPEPL
jgi:hypothetical protein